MCMFTLVDVYLIGNNQACLLIKYNMISLKETLMKTKFLKKSANLESCEQNSLMINIDGYFSGQLVVIIRGTGMIPTLWRLSC